MNEAVRIWTEAEIAALRALIDEGHRLPEIAAALGRSPKAVKVKAGKLGWSLLQASPFDDANVKCPFFGALKPGGRIRCEGVLKGSGATVSLFSETDAWEAQVKRYCHKDWKHCPIAQVLQRKYDE